MSVYLDNSSTSFPKAPGVVEAMSSYMMNCGASVGRGSYAEAFEAEELVFDTRDRLARLLGLDNCANIAFTRNVTEALNVLIKGYLKPNDHVLVSSMEHNAVMRPLQQLKAHGVSFSRIACDEQGMLKLDELERELRPTTKVVIMMHASNVVGTIMPIAEVGEFCRKHQLKFFVDAAQSAGVVPIDMKNMGIDAVCCTGHKSLLGPQGIGCLALVEGLASEIEPLVSGGTGSISDSEEVPTFMPDRLEAGTPNIPGIVGLREALGWIERTGMNQILNHELALTERFLAGLEPLEAKACVRIYGKRDCTDRLAVVSLGTPLMDEANCANLLASRYGILTRVGLHCAPSAHKTIGSFPQGTVRFSFGYATTPDEVDAALTALTEICDH